MKIGVVFFHKNIKNIYKDRWVKKSVNSMLNQTFKDFFIYEINYGGDDYSVVNNFSNKKFYKEKLNNYAEAMNYIITKAFDDNCDYVFNVNLDDYYSENRIEKQLLFLKKGYDIVSTDFCYIREVNENEDSVFHYMNITNFGSISHNLKNNHNIIAHPSVALSKKFWEQNKYDASKVPEEDLDLWKRAIEKGFKFFIVPECILFYRIHEKQVSNKKI